VETTASSQHSTRYLTGEIIADFIDEGADNNNDRISTDRQKLDWENEELAEFREWGERLTRRLLRECADKHGGALENWVLADTQFSVRLKKLDTSSQKQISQFLKTLGLKTTPDDERTKDLADSLIRVYEFRVFHDVIDDIERVGNDPEKLAEILGRLSDWKVLESRAILEIIQGRLSIIDKLEKMILENAPETASKKTYDNLHDLLAGYPWLFNPDWQTFAEEKSISKQLREWGIKECPEDMENCRVDFLAFGKDRELVVIEIKRPTHPVSYDELLRLEKYQTALMRTRLYCKAALVYGGTLDVPEQRVQSYQTRNDFELLTWEQMFSRARRYYEHYRAVLVGDVSDPSFHGKADEVAKTRQVLETTSHRSKEDRKQGLGNADL